MRRVKKEISQFATANQMVDTTRYNKLSIYHAHAEIILEKSIFLIDKAIASFEYLEEDQDCNYTPYIEEHIEVEHLDLTLHIDIKRTNTSLSINDVFTQDSNDDEYPEISELLNYKLLKYYDKQDIELATGYLNSCNIRSDQKEFFGLKTDKQRLDLLHDCLIKLSQLHSDKNGDAKLKRIFAGQCIGTPIKLRKEISHEFIVKTLVPMIDNGMFYQANKLSTNKEKGIFLQNCFGGSLGSYQNAITNII